MAIGRMRPSQRHSLAAVSLPRRLDLFRDQMLRRCRRRWCRRYHKRHPGIPAIWPILGGELLIGLEIEVALHVADREDEAHLRPDSENLRLEAADTIAR